MDEVITLASIVEREASKSDQRMIIASVFYNRLHNSRGTGGKLQSDATRWYPYATKKELLASDKLTQEEKDDWRGCGLRHDLPQRRKKPGVDHYA